MHRLERGRWALVLAVLLAIPVSAWAGPEIFSIEPESGPAGTPIQLKGKGLLTTGRVVFAVGRTISRARFKVVSDQEVDIIAPEYYRPGAAATVAVFTEHGAAVAMPATVQTVRSPVQGTNVTETGESFFHVLDGGILSTAGAVAVIEKGGVVVQSSEPAMQFVKSGGTLLEFHNANGIVFYEPAAKLGPGVVKPNRPAPVTLVRLPEITACPGVGPFRFVAAAATRSGERTGGSTGHPGVVVARCAGRRDRDAHRQRIRPNNRGEFPGANRAGRARRGSEWSRTASSGWRFPTRMPPPLRSSLPF